MRVEELLDKLDKKYVLKGADLLVSCINPEHNDAHPSMRIDRLTGMYHCFSCGVKGNILKEYGFSPDIVDTRVKGLRDKIAKLLTGALQIPTGATPFLHSHRGISSDTYNTFGAFTHPDYEGRVMFPITNYSGDIYAFIGRYIHSDISPKYKVFPKGTPLKLFPTKPELYNSSIILVEGLFDMLNLHENGLKNAVTAFGTNTLVKKTAELLEPYYVLGVTKIYIMFDADKAGKRAAERLKKIIPSKYNAEIIELPDGLDPGDLDSSMIEQIKETLYK